MCVCVGEGREGEGWGGESEQKEKNYILSIDLFVADIVDVADVAVGARTTLKQTAQKFHFFPAVFSRAHSNIAMWRHESGRNGAQRNSLMHKIRVSMNRWTLTIWHFVIDFDWSLEKVQHVNKRLTLHEVSGSSIIIIIDAFFICLVYIHVVHLVWRLRLSLIN